MSQFDSLFKRDVKEKEKAEAKPKQKIGKKKTADSPLSAIATSLDAQTEKRITGKSSNPDYAQALAYVKRTTLKSVKRELLDETNLDFSELVEKLLTDWLKNKK